MGCSSQTDCVNIILAVIFKEKVVFYITSLCSLLHMLLKDKCMCLQDESLVLQDKCNIVIFLSPTTHYNKYRPQTIKMEGSVW